MRLKKIVWNAIIFTVINFMIGCTNVSNVKALVVDDIFQILASPALYDGKEVTIRGWISMRHEDNNLWSTWQDHEAWNVNKCISLKNYFSKEDLRKSVDGKFVEIKGIFYMDADRDKNGLIVRSGSCNKFAIEFDGQSSIQILK